MLLNPTPDGGELQGIHELRAALWTIGAEICERLEGDRG